MSAMTNAMPSEGATPAKLRDRIFYSSLIVGLIAMIVVGHGVAYYFRVIFDPPPFTRLVSIHIATCNAWLLLLLIQSVLISADRRALHRVLGLLGAVLGAAFVVVGYMASLESLRRGFHPTPGPTASVFFAILVRGLLVFAIVIGAALYFRHDPETHKRLILIGTIAALLPAAAGRLAGEHQWVAALITLSFLAASPVYDKWSRGHVHSINKWVPWVVFATGPQCVLIAMTPMWDMVINILLA